MDALKAGDDVIAAAVGSLEPPVVVVEMHRQFGDILHATIVVRHLRAALPDHRIVFAVCESYRDALAYFGLEALGPHAYAFLPRLPEYPHDAAFRIHWVVQARSLPGVVRSFGCGAHPWGHTSGSIVDAVLNNAGISDLLVPRRPCLPILPADVDQARAFLRERGLSRYVALEYRSFSHEPLHPTWYESFVRFVSLPVVALAHAQAPAVAGAVDGRLTTLRQAKSIIADAACFVGCGSGLSVLAASLGCEQPVVENCDIAIAMPTIGYRAAGDRHVLCTTRSPKALADAVNSVVGGRIESAARARVGTVHRQTRAQRTRLRRQR